MDVDDLTAVKLHKEAVAKSKEMLSSITALEMLNRASAFHSKLDKCISELGLPTSVIIGILMCEIFKVSEDASDYEIVAGFEGIKRHIDLKFLELKYYVDTKDSLLKKHIEDNFIKKEISLS